MTSKFLHSSESEPGRHSRSQPLSDPILVIKITSASSNNLHAFNSVDLQLIHSFNHQRMYQEACHERWARERLMEIHLMFSRCVFCPILLRFSPILVQHPSLISIRQHRMSISVACPTHLSRPHEYHGAHSSSLHL